jgi:hypothetical protein
VNARSNSKLVCDFCAHCVVVRIAFCEENPGSFRIILYKALQVLDLGLAISGVEREGSHL